MLYDKDIREPLFEYIEDNFGKVRIIEEKQIGKSRADVMVVMDSMIIGIEIKSDADTYSRLERQVLDYNRCFDQNYVVVGTKHAGHIEEHVPEWWGIITVDEEKSIDEEYTTDSADSSVLKDVAGKGVKADFYVLRKPKQNPRSHHEFFRKRQLSFLWRPELSHIQEIHGFHKYANKSKKYVQDYIFENVDEDVLKKQITDELFERDYSSIAEKIQKYKDEHGVKKKKRKRKRKEI